MKRVFRFPLSSPADARHTTVTVHSSPHEASAGVARQIADLIRHKQQRGERAVLGLATGSTPTAVYNELVRMHRDEKLSFANVTTFNLDEYWPMRPDSLQSYRRFMREYLFDHLDIDPRNVNIPDGTVALDDVAAFCDDYERRIRAAGGIEIAAALTVDQPDALAGDRDGQLLVSGAVEYSAHRRFRAE